MRKGLVVIRTSLTFELTKRREALNMRNKVQTTDHGTNVLVECENSDGRHYSHLDFEVKNVKALTRQELIAKFHELATEDDIVDFAKQMLKKIPGFAISDTSNRDKSIKDNDLVSYEPI